MSMKDNRPHHEVHYIHRISYSTQERMVGVFVLSAVVVLLFLLFSTIKSQNIFEEQFTIYGNLKSAEGINTETIVQISGIEVGKVSSIEITENNRIMLTMHIFKRYHRLLRTDSKVKVSSLNMTIIGKSIIVITAGSADNPLIEEGAILDVLESNAVEDVISEAKNMLDDINQLVHSVSNVVTAVDLDKIALTVDSLHQFTDNLNTISQHMKSGEGVVGGLVYSESMRQDISKSLSNLQQATSDMKALLSSLKNDAGEVPLILNNINEVIDETEKTIQATQRVWPISSAMPVKDSSSKIMVSPQPAND